MDTYERCYAVWEFRSIDGRQVVVSVRPAHPDDYRYQSEYQRVLWRGNAPTPAIAESRALIGRGDVRTESIRGAT